MLLYWILMDYFLLFRNVFVIDRYFSYHVGKGELSDSFMVGVIVEDKATKVNPFKNSG